MSSKSIATFVGRREEEGDTATESPCAVEGDGETCAVEGEAIEEEAFDGEEVGETCVVAVEVEVGVEALRLRGARFLVVVSSVIEARALASQ